MKQRKDDIMKLTIQKNKTSRFPFLISVVFMLLLIESFHIVTIPQGLVLLLTVVIPVFLEANEIIAYAVCFSMLGTGIQVAYVCASCVICILTKNKFKLKKIQLIIPFVFVANELIRMFIFPEDSLIEIIRYLFVFFLVVIAVSSDLSQKERRTIIDAFIFSTACVVIMVLIETLSLSSWSLLRLLNGTLRLGYSEQLGGKLFFSSDPNMLGQSCSLVISLCLMIIFSEGVKIKYLIPLIICLLGGTLTISKTFLLSLILIFVLFLFGASERGDIAKTFFKKCCLLILVGLLAYLVYRLNPSYIENLLSRVDSSDITTGRVNNALTYVDALSTNTLGFFFGVGIQNVGPKIGFTGSPHAAIVEMIVCWGIIGAALIGGMIMFATYWHAKQSRNICVLNFIPILVFAFVAQTTQLFRLRDHVLCLIVAIITCGLELSRGKIYEEESVTDN